MDHSKYSPSTLHRWVRCPLSVKLCKNIPNYTSVYAEEGTLAHSVCENLIKNDGNLTLENISHEMLTNCMGYYKYFHKLNPVKYLLETKLNLSHIIPNTWGYCDLVVVDNKNIIHIIDFKYGKGVLVNCFKNEQMIFYALGVIEKLKLEDKQPLILHIYQPRCNNISQYHTTVEELKLYIPFIKKQYNESLKPNPIGKAGSKQCRFCLAKLICPVLDNVIKKGIELMIKFNKNKILTEEEKLFILENSKILTESIKSIEASLLQDAMKGNIPKGYKIVEGRSSRTWGKDAEQILYTNLGEKIYTKKMLGITEISKFCNKDTIDSLTIKPAGKPCLVKESDSRQPINENIKNMFSTK